MPEPVATAVVLAALIYALLGVVFAVYFVTRGAGRIDSVALGGTLSFRILIFPASAALWPWLLRRCLATPATQVEAEHH